MSREGGDLRQQIQRQLKAAGLAVELPDLADLDAANCKVICVPMGLAGSLRAMEREPRDQVVMVRVDEATRRALDAWVETGALRSRSEAAALFIREGLKLRSDELGALEAALKDVRRAKDRLQRRARDLLGERPRTADDS